MLRSISDLEDYAIQATDGVIGQVKDFYFDDREWVIRYLVVEAGTWLSSRKILISPISIGTTDWANHVLPVSLTKEQVRNSPDIDTDKPVSRQHEMAYLGYYGYPSYWGGTGLWGTSAYPGMLMTGDASLELAQPVQQSDAKRAYALTAAAQHQNDDPNLRSCEAVNGYHLLASDGDIGHVEGYLVDDETWAIRYVIVNTSNWWLGHKVLIAPQWIVAVGWEDATVSTSLTRQSLKDAPPYDAAVPLDRDQESNIYKHYGQTGYWVGEPRSQAVLQRHQV
jgi:hypothetical protein